MTTIGNIGGCMTTRGNVVVASCIWGICSDARKVGGGAIEVANCATSHTTEESHIVVGHKEGHIEVAWHKNDLSDAKKKWMKLSCYVHNHNWSRDSFF